MKTINKRGFIASYAVDFYAYLVFVAIIIIFFIAISFSDNQIEKSLPTGLASADVTNVLIKALQMPIKIGNTFTTPAEIISNEDTQHASEFQTAMRDSLDIAFPKKYDTQFAWIITYASQLSKEYKEYRNLDAACGGVSKEFYFKASDDFTYKKVQTDGKNIGVVDVPLKNSVDYATVVLCVGVSYLK